MLIPVTSPAATAAPAARVGWSAVLLGLLLTAAPALASDDLFRSKNCIACHRVDRTALGPSFKAVAEKHAGSPQAAEQLAKKIREGGGGVWGPIPMPAQPQVDEAEALTLARWILEQK